jgi:hypothetical protein
MPNWPNARRDWGWNSPADTGFDVAADDARIAEAIRGLDFDTSIVHIAYDAQGDLRAPQIYIFQVRGENLYRSIQNSQNPKTWVTKSNHRPHSPVVALFDMRD